MVGCNAIGLVIVFVFLVMFFCGWFLRVRFVLMLWFGLGFWGCLCWVAFVLIGALMCYFVLYLS